MRWDARRQVSAGQAFAVWVDIASGLASSTLPETMCVGAARMVQHIILQAIYLGTCGFFTGCSFSGITRTSSPCQARRVFSSRLASTTSSLTCTCVPNCENRPEHGSGAFKERWARGPWGTTSVFAGQPNVGRNLCGTWVSAGCAASSSIEQAHPVHPVLGARGDRLRSSSFHSEFTALIVTESVISTHV